MQAYDDYRKADPRFINFVPKTAGEAIDLFHRMKRLGLRPEHFPEAFVWVTRKLNDDEGAKFEEYLVAPQGVSAADVLKGADPEQEKIRLQLVAEAEQRDLEEAMRRARIDEEDDEKAASPLVFDMDEEDAPPPHDAPMVLSSPR